MKYYGKEKCRILKEIRAEIAKQNDIEWVVSECKHQGNCKGTCPKCEQEVRQLEEALARREALGKKVAVVGVSATIALTVTGCDLFSQTTAGVDPETENRQTTPQTHQTDTQANVTDPTVKGEFYLPPESDTDPEDITTAGVPMYPEETTAPEVVEPMGDMPV
jgi:hypothetical protein